MTHFWKLLGLIPACGQEEGPGAQRSNGWAFPPPLFIWRNLGGARRKVHTWPPDNLHQSRVLGRPRPAAKVGGDNVGNHKDSLGFLLDAACVIVPLSALTCLVPTQNGASWIGVVVDLSLGVSLGFGVPLLSCVLSAVDSLRYFGQVLLCPCLVFPCQ